MPELPEVERARAAIAEAGLGRRIADVDDTDTYKCRPHPPGEIRAALLGRTLIAAHRRGKRCGATLRGGSVDGRRARCSESTWGCPGASSSARHRPARRDGGTVEGGDPRPRRALPGETRWNRFTLFFADGGSLVLLDPRRLGRVRLDPGVDVLGPDALTVSVAQFRVAMARGTAPVKARLLDQTAIAGVGNLLADEALWQARLDPRRSVSSPGRRRGDAPASVRPARGRVRRAARRRAHRRPHLSPSRRWSLSPVRR